MATNAARYRMVAGRTVKLLEFGLRRAQGPDGGLSASKYSYIGKINWTLNCWHIDIVYPFSLFVFGFELIKYSKKILMRFCMWISLLKRSPYTQAFNIFENMCIRYINCDIPVSLFTKLNSFSVCLVSAVHRVNSKHTQLNWGNLLCRSLGSHKYKI